MIEHAHPNLSVRQQCELLGLNRSSFYYEGMNENDYNLLLMNYLDEEYTRYPFKGVLRMVEYLKELGHRDWWLRSFIYYDIVIFMKTRLLP